VSGMRNLVLGGLSLSIALGLGTGCGSDASDSPSSGGTSSGGSSSGGDGGSSADGGSSGSGGAGGSSTGGSGGLGGGGGVGGVAGASGAAGSPSGGTGGNNCTDPGAEPNNSVVFAVPACPLPCELDECDDQGSTGYGGPKPSLTGVTGPGDPDNFKFDGIDDLGLCVVDVGAKTEDSGFRLCVFASCKAGATSFGSCTGGTQEEIDGVTGCCTTAPGEVEIDYDCTGTPTDNDSATGIVRVDSATACTPYTVDYHF
jgi:hypothetical protein